MKKFNLFAATIMAAGSIVGQNALAQTVTYDTTQTAINGDGNTDLGWSVYSGTGLTANTLTLATMAEWNYPGYPNNATAPSDPNDSAGTFLFPTGTKPGSLTRGNYDIWFSVDTGTSSLADSGLDFYWSISTTGVGTPSGPIELSLYPDSEYGNDTTPNGGGTKGTYAAESGSFNLFQNAQDPSWLMAGYDPNANQIVTVDLYAVATGAGALGTKVGEITSTVDVGVVPEPSTVGLSSLGALALFGINRFRRKS